MPEFKQHQFVRHTRTGKAYIILQTPAPNHLLEATGEQFYAYREFRTHPLPDDKIWYRAASQMEDGRFVVLTSAERAALHPHFK